LCNSHLSPCSSTHLALLLWLGRVCNQFSLILWWTATALSWAL
jgi:hypothetical protein